MSLFKMITITLSLAFTTPVAALDISPDQIRMPVASDHINSAAELNETNPGLALTWEGRGLDLTAGVVHNSFGNKAPFVTVSHDWWANDACAVASFAGTARYKELEATTSYQYEGWIPIAGMHVECGNMFVQAMPGRGLAGGAAGEGQADAILVFGFTVDLNN